MNQFRALKVSNVQEQCYLIVVAIRKEFLYDVALSDNAHGAHFL